MSSPLEAVRRFVADETYRRMPDDQLWERFRDHADGDALRQFLERVGRRVSACCRAVTGDPALADDALQNALIRLVRDRRLLRTYPAALSWLYTTARNEALMAVRARDRARRRERKAAKPEAAPAEPDPGDSDPVGVNFSAVAAAVAELPGRERRVLELVYLEGMTHEQAAAALGMNRGSVGTYVLRGRERLRKRFAPAALAGAAVAGGRLPAARAEALAAVALTGRLASPGWAWWVKGLAVVALTATAVGGVGWVAATGARAPAAVAPAPPADEPTEPVPPEGLADRHRRAFAADVLPELLAALRSLAGPGEEVAPGPVAVHDTRTDVAVVVRRVRDGRVTRRLRFVADADTRQTAAYIDPFNSGRYQRFLQPVAGRPAVVLRLWDGGPRVDLPVEPLAAAVRAFEKLPRDEVTAAEGRRFRAAFRASLADRYGAWRHGGRAAEVWRLEWPAGADRPRLLAPPGAGWSLADGRTWYTIEPDGPLGSGLLFEDEPAAFGPDGRRLTFARTGEWWDRPSE